MSPTLKPTVRASAIGAGAAAALIGAFLLGTAQSGSAATSGPGIPSSTSAPGKITVTGTGTVTGKPSQLVLSMGVQVNGSSVSSALQQANQAASKVMAALKKDGVPAADVQTSGLSIQPNYHGSSQVPVSYGVSEQLTATLGDLGKAGSQIQDAVTAGGNATTVDGISLKMTDTGSLLAAARARAVADAKAKATQFAGALGEHVTGVVSVSDQSQQVPVFYGDQSAGFRAAAPSVPISAGKQQVSVQITVVYAIG